MKDSEEAKLSPLFPDFLFYNRSLTESLAKRPCSPFFDIPCLLPDNRTWVEYGWSAFASRID
ncbi:hypothetical protein [Paenibacillus roseus]|uniref:hypothetical protein n=1 Tax=Paenibacillus sp. GCM10012307 TaxID=3317343 RepID=UPI0036D420BE